ncbi:MAG: TRC40/GET3/ArsA family transport-energizing ATPase [Promethearchaeota archaeon]
MINMGLKELFKNDHLKFVLFGGKGGVGKTTCAVSTSIWAAENLKKNILIVSTDPAHSLSDSLGQALIPGAITKIEGFKNLSALELNPKSENTKFKNLLNNEDEIDGPLGMGLTELMGFDLPGIDEALAFGKILEFLNDADYDLVIFDTAPTGHTLRLLSLPETLSGLLGKILMLRLKLGTIFGSLRNLFKSNKNKNEIPQKEMIDSLNKLKTSIESAKEVLSDEKYTSFVICMIPEAMAIYETERLLSALYEYNIPANNIIINQLTPENPDCRFCTLRRSMQQKHLQEIKELYEDEFTITEVPLFDKEIRNINTLKEFAEILFK